MENKFEIVPSKKDMVIEFSQGLFNSLVIPEDYPEFISKSINIYDNPDFIDRQGADITVCTTNDKDEIIGLNIEVRSFEAKELERKQFKDLFNEIEELQTMVKNVPADEYAKNLDLFGKISHISGGAKFLSDAYYGDNEN